MRLKVKNITEMSIKDLCAKMNTALILSINYGSIPQIVKEEMLENLCLSFNRN